MCSDDFFNIFAHRIVLNNASKLMFQLGNYPFFEFQADVHGSVFEGIILLPTINDDEWHMLDAMLFLQHELYTDILARSVEVEIHTPLTKWEYYLLILLYKIQKTVCNYY